MPFLLGSFRVFTSWMHLVHMTIYLREKIPSLFYNLFIFFLLFFKYFKLTSVFNIDSGESKFKDCKTSYTSFIPHSEETQQNTKLQIFKCTYLNN